MLKPSVASALGIGVLAALVASGIRPYDRATWVMEVAPILIAAPILLLTYRRFPLTALLYVLIGAHALVAREILLRARLQDRQIRALNSRALGSV